jgi:hypothetical protein
MVRRLVACLAAALAPLAACAEPEPRCTGAVVTLRNPDTLACVQRQLPSADCPDIAPSPPWPVCKHPCNDIRDENLCVFTPGCRVTRELCNVFDDRCEREGPFIGCFAVNTGEAAAGECTALAASACATRDDCGAQYLHGPDCPDGAPPDDPTLAAPRADGPRCRFTFVTCFDELAPPPP